MGLFLPTVRTTQPQQPVEIDRSNLLTRGLVEVVLPLSLVDRTVITGFSPVVVGTGVVSGVGVSGRNIRLPESGLSNGIKISDAADRLFPSATDATIFLIRRSIDTTPRGTMAFGYVGDSNSRVLAHAPWADGNVYWDFGGESQSQRISAPFAKSVNVESLAFVAGGGKGREIWRNGVKIAGDTSKTGTRVATGFGFGLGAAASPGLNSDSEEVYLFGVASRAWSDAEITSWHKNPWQIFAPSKKVVYFLPSAGGLISLSGVVVGSSLGNANSAFTLFQTGASSTGVVGSATPNTTTQNVGSTTALATGSTSASATLPVSGVSATTSAGIITYVLSGVGVALGGAELSSVAGVTTVSVACSAVGVPITLTAGTPISANTKSVAGSPSALTAGTTISANTKSVAGSTLSAVIGSLISALNRTLPPQQSVLSNGTLTYVLAGLSGLIVEGSAIDTWVISVSMCADNTSAGTVTSTGATYSLTPTQNGIARVTCSPKVDYSWTASRTATVGDFCVGINPLNLFRCTTGGTTGTVEPSWPTSGTISDNSAVWTFVAPLVNPITKLMVI
jgi:hypothetical protein